MPLHLPPLGVITAIRATKVAKRGTEMITTIRDEDGARVTTITGNHMEIMSMTGIMTMVMSEDETLIITMVKGNMVLNRVKVFECDEEN